MSFVIPLIGQRQDVLDEPKSRVDWGGGRGWWRRSSAVQGTPQCGELSGV